MLEYLKNSVWLRIWAFSLICVIISSAFAGLTGLQVVYIIAFAFFIFNIFSLAITVYFTLKRSVNMGAMISAMIFFLLLSGALYVSNIILESEYVDMAWRYSLAISGVIILIQVFLLFFGKGKNNNSAGDAINNSYNYPSADISTQQEQNTQSNVINDSHTGGENNG